MTETKGPVTVFTENGSEIGTAHINVADGTVYIDIQTDSNTAELFQERLVGLGVVYIPAKPAEKEKKMNDGKLGPEEINHRFGFHKATVEGQNATLPKHTELRKTFIELASHLDDILPAGRAKSVAFTELENASMWAHKAVAEHATLIEE